MTNKKQTSNITTDTTTTTEWEKKNDKVSRKELRKNILGFFDELDDDEFHATYHMLWAWTASKLLAKVRKERRD